MITKKTIVLLTSDEIESSEPIEIKVHIREVGIGAVENEEIVYTLEYPKEAK